MMIMAENKKYKYKTDEIDSELFKKNLLSNYESYVKHQGYKGDELSQFKASFDNYLKAFDQGTLSTEYDGSITDTSGSLKNEGFDQHVAKYFNIVGNAVNQKTQKKTEKKKTKFSLDEHGFWNAFGKDIAPGGTGDLEAWMNQDAYDEKSKSRGITNRVTHFNNFLDQYIANFGDYDFEGSAFKSKEDYLGRLRKVKEALADNTLSENEYLVLNQAGLDPKMYKAAFATGKTYSDAVNNQAQIEQQKKQEFEEGLRQDRTAYDTNPYHALQLHTGTFKYTPLAEDLQPSDSDRRLVLNFQKGLNTQNNAFALSYMLDRDSQDITEGQYKGWKSVADSYDDKSKSILVINPNTYEYKRAFIGDVNDYYNNYLQERYKKKNPDSWMSSYNYAVYSKEGGKFQEGGSIDSDEKWLREKAARDEKMYKEGLSKRAKASGNTEEYQKNMERHVLSGSGNMSDPESTGLNFSTEDYFDLGALAADIYSGLSDPITGTVAGVASSLTNFGTDLSRGKGLWDATKGLGTNLLFDAISIIPVFGDAVGSGGKVVQKLSKWAPKILNVLSTGRMLAGLGEAGEGIIQSFEKIGKEGKENELTSQDFKNILSGLNMIIQGGKGLSSSYSKSKAKKAAEMPDNVDVKVKQNGQTKILRFSGEEAKQIKNLKTPDEVKNFIVDKHKSYKDIEIQTKSDGTGGSQWIWSRDKGDGTKRSFWSWDNFRSPYRQSGQTADISTVDYDKVRRTQFDYRVGRFLRPGNNNVDRVGARGLGEQGQELFKGSTPVEAVKQARKRKTKPTVDTRDNAVETKPDYYYDETEAFWDKQGGSLVLKAQEGTQLVADGKLKRIGKGTPDDPFRFVNLDGTEVGSNIVAYGKLKRLGSGTAEDPYRFVNNDENESAVDANYQNPVVTNEQFLPKKEDIIQHLDKLTGENQSVNVQPYVKPDGSKNDTSIKENPLENIKMSKVLDFLKYSKQKEHNKKQLDLALARPTRNDQIAQMTENVITGQDDLRKEAERQAASLMNVAKNSSTTDSLVNREIMLKAAIAGNEGKMKQAIAENAAIATAREKNLAIRNQNELARVQGANANNYYALLKKDDDYKARAAFNQANNLSDVNMFDKLIKEAINREIPEDTGAERKEMQESVKMQNYQTDIIENPEANGLLFDEATKQLIKDVRAGVKKSENMTDEEKETYTRASNQIAQMVKVKMARDKHLNLNFNPTPIETPFTTVVTGLPSEKDGGRITVAKIKKKIEKAKLQQRQLEDKMKNYQKDLDRLSRRSDTYKREK